jgi:TatD DNase family protein
MKSLFEQLGSPEFLFDSHCHLNDSEYDENRETLISESVKTGVKNIFDIGITLESSKSAITNAAQFAEVKAFVGIDPEVCIPGSHFYDPEALTKIESYSFDLENLILQNSSFIIGIGETGLDHYWTKELGDKARVASHKIQESLFRMHLELAQKHELPLSIHSRGAEATCLEILKEYKVYAIFHSYTGDYETAKKILKSGNALGINGIFTFKKATEIREMYVKLFEEAGLLNKVKNGKTTRQEHFYKKGFYFETDAPFLSPEGKRGERNVPKNVKDIYEVVLRSMSENVGE